MADEKTGNWYFSLVEGSLLSLYHSTRALAVALPPSALVRLYRGLGSLALAVRPGLRDRLRERMCSALPGPPSTDELDRLAREACSAALLPMLDLALFRLYSTRMMRLLEVEGLENFDRADRMGRGMILVGTHLGAFVIRLAVMTRLRRPYTPVMLHPENSTVGGYVKTLALHGKELGCDPSTPVLWARRGVMGAIKEQLSRGKRIYIAIDVGGKRVVKFLGRPTALADGIGRLALDTGAPVVPFTLLRGSEPLSLRLSVRPPLRFSLGGNREEDVQSIMTEVAAAGERMILEAPGQWMGWFGLAHWWKEAEKRDG